jgi:hypothetical protein
LTAPKKFYVLLAVLAGAMALLGEWGLLACAAGAAVMGWLLEPKR